MADDGIADLGGHLVVLMHGHRHDPARAQAPRLLQGLIHIRTVLAPGGRVLEDKDAMEKARPDVGAAVFRIDHGDDDLLFLLVDAHAARTGAQCQQQPKSKPFSFHLKTYS